MTSRVLELHKPYIAPKAVGGGNNFRGGYQTAFTEKRFELNTVIKSNLGRKLVYDYEGVTACGIYDVSMRSAVELDMSLIYSGRASSSAFVRGRTNLTFSKYSIVEDITPLSDDDKDDLALEDLSGGNAKKN